MPHRCRTTHFCTRAGPLSGARSSHSPRPGHEMSGRRHVPHGNQGDGRPPSTARTRLLLLLTAAPSTLPPSPERQHHLGNRPTVLALGVHIATLRSAVL